MLPVSLLDFERQFLNAARRRKAAPPPGQLFEPMLAVRSAAEQLDHYQNTIACSFDGTLKKIYPVVHALVGEAFFVWMAPIFLEQMYATQPHFPEHMRYFPDFLAQFSPLAQHPYLADLARLEWAWYSAHQAPDDTPFDFDALGLVPPLLQADIVFHLPKSAMVVASGFPILRLWEVNQAGFLGEKSVDWEAGGQVVLVWRDQGKPSMVVLGHEESEAMRLFAASLPFSEICERLAAIEGMPSAAALLPHYIQNKWLASFSLPDTDRAIRGNHGG